MARSYRKTPIVKDIMKSGKKMANRKVRRSKDIPNGGAYKKFYPQWDVIDWVYYNPITRLEKYYRERSAPHQRWWRDEITPEEYVNKWAKEFFWK